MKASSMSFGTVFFVLLLLISWYDATVQCDADDVMSSGSVRNVYLRHSPSTSSHHAAFELSSTSVSSSMVVMVPELTTGPFPEAITDYIYTSDLLAAAKAGASGVTSDRTSVLNGIPISLVFNVYNVTGSTGTPLVGADVFVWHADALGIYSSVNLTTAPTNVQDTTGQFWLRGYQTVNSTGTVVFNTILPGWEIPRALHYHVRVRLADAATSTTFIVTTQLFISQTLTNTIAVLSPYSGNSQTQTALASDMVYTTIDSTLASELILNTVGSTTAGYTTTFNLGVAVSTSSTSTTTTSSTSSSTTTASPTTSSSTTSSASSSTNTNAASSGVALSGIVMIALMTVAVLFTQRSSYE